MWGMCAGQQVKRSGGCAREILWIMGGGGRGGGGMVSGRGGRSSRWKPRKRHGGRPLAFSTFFFFSPDLPCVDKYTKRYVYKRLPLHAQVPYLRYKHKYTLPSLDMKLRVHQN